jgi:hypothetical protein
METFTIRAAAERCGVTYQSMRKRVDRRSIETVKRDGVRLIPRSELERAGIWPGVETGAPEHVQELQAEIDRLTGELRALRALPEQVAVERQARELVENALHEERAGRASTQQRLEAIEKTHAAAAITIERLTQGGPVERWRARRAVRQSAATNNTVNTTQ